MSHHRFRDAANEGSLKRAVDSDMKEGTGNHGGVGDGVGGAVAVALVGAALWWQAAVLGIF